jgi:UDP-N-acetylmuramoyl-L-alanyl-D-glutamate--2,6-diaminopimelate ligase
LRLDRLLGAVPVPGLVEVLGDTAAVEVVEITNDSSAVTDGALYCCLRGAHVDGHDFAAPAVEAGAVALLVERPLEPLASVPQVVVRDARVAMGPVASEVFGNPSRTLDVVGVTGTNGKTTTTYLVRAILEAAGRPTGVLGTMSASRTTPEAPLLQRTLAGFVAEGKAAAAIEVSSIGLVQHRVDGTRFAAAIFTHLSQDHLDDHGSMEAYFDAKALLFRPELTAVAVVDVDDEWGRRLVERLGSSVEVRPYSLDDVDDLDVSVGSSTFVWDGERVTLPMDGVYNVSNAIAAATACRALGVSADAVAAGLGSIGVVAGHGEAVDGGQDFRVVVDYAHTPLALESVLQSARRAAGSSGRVLCVFGCGGDRDPTKRAPMGWAASSVADVVVVTSDNPRTEDPDAIIARVVEGATGGAQVLVEPDRRAAISLAFARASAGDVVVIAGKGHETGQTIGTTVHPFDDKEVALDLLRGRRPAS